jgi:DNA polymerase alpha-associated DNA helicase A
MRKVCWIPILKTSKLILAGDPLQLPPTVISSNEKKQKSKVKDNSRKTSTSKSITKKPQGKSTASGKASSKSSLATKESDAISTENQLGSDSEEDEAYDLKIGKRDLKRGTLTPSKSLEVTLFDRMERMWGDEIKQMLEVQYRCVSH